MSLISYSCALRCWGWFGSWLAHASNAGRSSAEAFFHAVWFTFIRNVHFNCIRSEIGFLTSLVNFIDTIYFIDALIFYWPSSHFGFHGNMKKIESYNPTNKIVLLFPQGNSGLWHNWKSWHMLIMSQYQKGMFWYKVIISYLYFNNFKMSFWEWIMYFQI